MERETEFMSRKQIQSVAWRLSVVGIVGNILLSGFKLAAGICGSSGAMVSDALHSLSDVFATLIAYFGVRIAGKAPDIDHPYGHDRFECVISLVLSAVLLLTGAGIAWAAIKSIFLSPDISPEIPGKIALIAAVVSIAFKEWMFQYTKRWAERIHSSAFLADAWHHRADALSSVGALIGIAGARLGYSFMDPLAGLVIAGMIGKVAFDICRDALSKMVDHACPASFEAQLRTCILSQTDVQGIDLILTRKFGERVYVDVELCVDGTLSLEEAHKIAESVHQRVEQEFPTVKHIMVHLNPGKKNQ